MTTLKTIKEKLQVLISYIYWKRNKGRQYAYFTQRDIELLWLYYFGMPTNIESITRTLRKLVEEGYIESLPNKYYNGKGTPKVIYRVYESVVLPEDAVYIILSMYNIIGGEILFELVNIFRDKNLFKPLVLLYKYYKGEQIPDKDKELLVMLGFLDTEGELTDIGKRLVSALKTLLKYYLTYKNSKAP